MGAAPLRVSRGEGRAGRANFREARPTRILTRSPEASPAVRFKSK